MSVVRYLPGLPRAPHGEVQADADRHPIGPANPSALRALPGPDDAADPSDDLGLMLSAVAERLRAGGLPNDTCCADALDQLRAGITLALAQGQQARLDLLQARAELARQHTAMRQLRAKASLDRHDAMHDCLTALPNRAAVRQRMEALLVPCNSLPPTLAVLFLDLDDFKPVNDRHGHAIGDQVLQIVAARLQHVMRSGDVVGRMGGDEFACLLADAGDRAQLSLLASKLHQAVSAPLVLNQLLLVVRPSIGIALCPSDGTTADSLLRRADAAMYRAKRCRSGHAFYDHHRDAA